VNSLHARLKELHKLYWNFKTSTCYLGHLCPYLMQTMLDPSKTQVLVFYFCAAFNLTFENFPLFHTLSFYTALLSVITSLTYILQKYCKWTLFVQLITFQIQSEVVWGLCVIRKDWQAHNHSSCSLSATIIQPSSPYVPSLYFHKLRDTINLLLCNIRENYLCNMQITTVWSN
jgi:hypothetical protein